MTPETPSITACNYGAFTTAGMPWNQFQGTVGTETENIEKYCQTNPMAASLLGMDRQEKAKSFLDQNQARAIQIAQQITQDPKKLMTQNRRIVQVFIADPNENVPLDKSVLYTGDQKLTDLTDTELYFEVPIAQLLADHNKARVTFLDKDATKRAGKDVFLDPVKIRDLKMVVVTVAQF